MTLVSFNPAQMLGEALTKMLLEYRSAGTPVLLFLSGGSSLEPLAYVKPETMSGLVTLTTLDERHDPSGLNSNFRALARTEFFKQAQLQGAQVIDTCVLLGESHTELADRIETDVRAWTIEHPHGVMLAVAGVGADGHTAGIMPYSEDRVAFTERFEGERFFVAYDASGKNPLAHRVTATMTLIRKLTHVFVYARGAEKREARVAMKEQGPLAECPARIYQSVPATFYFGD